MDIEVVYHKHINLNIKNIFIKKKIFGHKKSEKVLEFF
jgi:hypothetical protein